MSRRRWGVFRVLCPCGHAWVSVAPMEPEAFECPRCGKHRARAVTKQEWEAALPVESDRDRD